MIMYTDVVMVMFDVNTEYEHNQGKNQNGDTSGIINIIIECVSRHF